MTNLFNWDSGLNPQEEFIKFLNQLYDVNIDAPGQGDILTYNTETGMWENTTFSVEGATGYLVLLYQNEEEKILGYPPTEDGFGAALTAAEDGDVVWLPPSTISGNHTVPSGVSVTGASRKKSILTGEISLEADACLEQLTVERREDTINLVCGVTDVDEGISYIKECTIDVENEGGAAWAVYMQNGGTFYVHDSTLLALVGTEGYAAASSNGILYQIGGRAKGTIPLMPYSYGVD